MKPSHLALVVLLLAGCGSAASTPLPLASPTPAGLIYGAVGASETVGVGATDAVRDAWPAVFARSALPPTAHYRNFGISGEKVSGALVDELPQVLNVKPTVITLWLNVNDINAGVPVAEYQAQLTQLVHALRQGGRARVLVANTPHLDQLPVYLACRSGATVNGVACPGKVTALQLDAVNSAVDGYNTAIAAVVQQEGAELVDLHSQGEVPVDHPEYVSRDGFHPSTAGHAAIAGKFVEVYLKHQ